MNDAEKAKKKACAPASEAQELSPRRRDATRVPGGEVMFLAHVHADRM